MALLSLRTTPLDNQLPSLAEILYGRKIKTRIPTFLNSNNSNDNQIRDRMNIYSKKQQQYYNRNAKDLPELTIGSKVLVLQENDAWLPATVIDKCAEPSNYIVDGKLLRWDRWHLREIYRPQRCPIYDIQNQGINTSQSQQTNTDHTEKVNTTLITTQQVNTTQIQTRQVDERTSTLSERPTRTRKVPWKFKDFIFTNKLFAERTK